MDRIQMLNDRIKKLEEHTPTKYIEYSYDKPKLASALIFLGFVGLIIFGSIFHWHWGLLLGISFIGLSIILSQISDQF